MGDMATATVKTRILIISDTHCAPLTKDKKVFPPRNVSPPFAAPLPKADLLIHCGDLTNTGLIEEYHGTLDMLKAIDAPVKLVIAGNHDLTLDRDFVYSHPASYENQSKLQDDVVRRAHDLWHSPDGRAKKEGITMLNEGVHSITLPNGAQVTIYASPYTPEFCDWGFPYKHREDRFNTPLRGLSDATNIAPYPVPSFTSAVAPIDILLTHGPPYNRMDWTIGGDLAGCPHLLRAAMRSRPLLHCFGHIHEGWGAERVTWSKDADRVTDSPCSINDWKKRAWREGVENEGKQIERVDTDLDEAEKQHAVFLDASEEGDNAIKRGQETLMVNASIMNVSYRPINAPWIVDLDLPKAP